MLGRSSAFFELTFTTKLDHLAIFSVLGAILDRISIHVADRCDPGSHLCLFREAISL